jgi:hypothetical protein
MQYEAYRMSYWKAIGKEFREFREFIGFREPGMPRTG